MIVQASLQFSSVVGPSAAVLVGGCPLKSVYSLLPAQSGLSMAVSVITYADQVFVAVATDSSLEPAGNVILNQFHAQVNLVESSVYVKYSSMIQHSITKAQQK